MESTAQEPKPALNPVGVFFASFGLAIVFSVLFSALACSIGLSFSGLDLIITVPCAVLFSAIATPVVAAFFKQATKRLRWRMVWFLVPTLSLLSVVIMSWVQTRQHLRISMGPMAVPDSVRVRHGRSILFSSFVHFMASPSDISTLIQSKELIEVPDWDPDSNDAMPEGFNERERSKNAWNWWQPASMSGARFYHRHHKSDAPQGWTEGWWVNDKTNEVFAYISG